MSRGLLGTTRYLEENWRAARLSRVVEIQVGTLEPKKVVLGRTNGAIAIGTSDGTIGYYNCNVGRKVN